MAITGTKVRTNTSNKNWFVNECKIVEAEQIDSQYNDCSVRLKLEDKDNQIILSGTAYYDFNHFATYWKR